MYSHHVICTNIAFSVLDSDVTDREFSHSNDDTTDVTKTRVRYVPLVLALPSNAPAHDEKEMASGKGRVLVLVDSSATFEIGIIFSAPPLPCPLIS